MTHGDPLRDIPDPVKRLIRQRCGFCCSLCGCPIYQYHHIVEYAELRKTYSTKAELHRPELITLLCGTCHEKEKHGLIPATEIVSADKSPWGMLHKKTEQENFLYFSGPNVFVYFGEGALICVPRGANEYCEQVVLQIEDFDAIRVEWERAEERWTPLLSATLQDGMGRDILVIKRNEVEMATDSTDITFIKNVLEIKITRHGKIVTVAKIIFNARKNALRFERCWICYATIEIQLKDSALFMSSSASPKLSRR